MSELLPELNTESLFRAWQAGDSEAGADISRQNTDFIGNCAVAALDQPGHNSTRVGQEDLMQVGAESVLERASKVDPAKAEKNFRRYQTLGIIVDMTQVLREHGGAVELPLEKHQLFARYWTEEDRRLREGESPPTTTELADLLKVPINDRDRTREFKGDPHLTVSDFHEALSLTRAQSIETLFGSASELPASAIPITIEEDHIWCPQPEAITMRRETTRLAHELIHEAFSPDNIDPNDPYISVVGLKSITRDLAREKMTIILVYDLDGGGHRTIPEIAEILGVTLERARILNKKAHGRLKAAAEEMPRFEALDDDLA